MLRGALYRKFARRRRKKKKPEKATIELPADPKTFRSFSPEIRTAFGELQGTVDRLEEENSKLKKKLGEVEKKERIKEYKEAAKIKEQMDKETQRNRIIIPFSGDGGLPSLVSAYDHTFFKDHDGYTWKIWKGLVFENTPDGLYLHFLVGKPGLKKTKVIRGLPFENWPMLFNPNTLFMDMKLGRLPIRLNREGMFIPPVMGTPAEAEPMNSPDARRMLQIDLEQVLANADRDTRLAFYAIYRKWREAMSVVREAQNMEKAAIVEKIKSQMGQAAADSMVDHALPSLDDAMERLAKTRKEQDPIKLERDSAQMHASGTAVIVAEQWDLIKSLAAKLKELGVPVSTRNRQEMMRDLESLAVISQPTVQPAPPSVQPSSVQPSPSQPTVVKGGGKK